MGSRDTYKDKLDLEMTAAAAWAVTAFCKVDMLVGLVQTCSTPHLIIIANDHSGCIKDPLNGIDLSRCLHLLHALHHGHNVMHTNRGCIPAAHAARIAALLLA